SPTTTATKPATLKPTPTKPSKSSAPTASPASVFPSAPPPPPTPSTASSAPPATPAPRTSPTSALAWTSSSSAPSKSSPHRIRAAPVELDHEQLQRGNGMKGLLTGALGNVGFAAFVARL